jgi:polyisoprenoid-binding protein YceI
MTTTTELSELTGDYALDPARTRIGFAVRQMVTKVRGHFDEFEGSAHLDGDDPSRSSARLTIGAKSIQTGNQRRDDHLGTSFLDVRTHPTITFTSTKVEQVNEVAFKVTGDVTMRGVTKPVTVHFELTGTQNDPRGGFRADFEGRATVNRKDWGIIWNATLESGGVLVSEKVTLEFDVSMIRQPF